MCPYPNIFIKHHRAKKALKKELQNRHRQNPVSNQPGFVQEGKILTNYLLQNLNQQHRNNGQQRHGDLKNDGHDVDQSMETKNVVEFIDKAISVKKSI